MKQLLPYRILSFVLLPIAALLSIMILLMLFMTLANPAVLLPLFMIACVVIYVIATFVFLQKGIDQNKICKSSLRDWIRVNAIVSIIFSVLCFTQSIGLLNSPQLLKEQIAQVAIKQPNFPVGSEAMLAKGIKGTLYFMLIFSGILLIHIIYTFRILKVYKHFFSEK